MNISTLRQRFAERTPLLNIVLDGWGVGDGGAGDAIAQANTPVLDRLQTTYPSTTILTHGHHVGLPTATDIGGSEVGHMTMGAGRIVPQGPTRIGELIANGRFFSGESLTKLISNCVQGDHALHLIGLLSDGNVHSHISHFDAIIRHASSAGVNRVFVHALLDGRDVPYQSALDYLEPMEDLLAQETAKGVDRVYAIASGGGREVITMDRDKNWDKVEKGWQVHMEGKGGTAVDSACAFVQQVRQRQPDIVDQDIPPFVVVQDGKPVGIVQDGDSVIFMNFRGDRAVQFSEAIEKEGFDGFPIERRPKVLFAGMAVYDEDTNLPARRLVETPTIENPFGKRIMELGLRQFRLTETQKFAHVTFFYNGGYREPLDDQLETYHLIPSDKVDSFAQQPKMKASEIADQALVFLADSSYKFGLINFANADMVGHTGDIAAVIRAVEAVDSAVGRIIEKLEKIGGVAVITADHGNADEMVVVNPKTGIQEPSTRHSINPVPAILVDPENKGSEFYQLRNGDKAPNTLANLLATNFVLLGLEPPDGVSASLFDLS